ncbi:MAG: hypothetical protein Kow0042_16840 [Calditrichia bacterium]
MNRRIINTLFICYVLFVVYNTLIPFSFDYGLSDLGELLRKVEWRPFVSDRGRLSLTDLAGNVILFIPFGFLCYMALQSAGARHPIFLTLLGGAILSISIEFVQLFIKYRNTAPHDTINNVAGALIGALLAAIYSAKISNLARRIFYELLDRKPFLLILVIVGLIQMVAAVMPFTVSITFSDLVKSIKNTNIIPLDYQSIGKLFFNSPNQHDALPFEIFAFFEDVLFWIAIGYLLMLCYRIYWRRKPYGRWLLIGLPLVYFPLREFAQLIIISRITDINDIISGYLGIAAGIGFYYLLRPIRRKTFHQHLDLLAIPLGFYAIFILFAGFQPFDWSLSPEVIHSNLAAYNLVPFYSYFKKTSLWNMYDLINSLTFFLPISLYWTARLRLKNIPWYPIYFKTTLSGLGIGLLIELTQLLSKVRVAEITDVLAYALGGTLGTFLIYYWEHHIRQMLGLYRQGILLGKEAESGSAPELIS